MNCPVCPYFMKFIHWICETGLDDTQYYYGVYECDCGTKIKAPVGEVLVKGRGRLARPSESKENPEPES